MTSYARNGPASRALALDLVLRTFMNSADFSLSSSRVWENISRLVPGTTPQQCAQRWEELLRSTNSAVAGDFSGLAATGRPISGYSGRQRRHPRTDLPNTPGTGMLRPSSGSRSSRGTSSSQAQEVRRPQSVMLGRIESSKSRRREDGVRRSTSSEEKGWEWGVEPEEEGDLSTGYHMEQTRKQSNQTREPGTFTSIFYKNLLSKSEERKEQQSREGSGHRAKEDSKQESSKRSDPAATQELTTATSSESAPAIAPSTPNMIIHVCDDAKKLKNDFVCPRDVLVREMRYFADYLSSEAQLWDEVDISVHCDIPVFEWLMCYTKQGMLSGPSGEELTRPLTPPTLEANNAVSILISSKFLKMDRLVEECLVFCHRNMSAVVASPCNMGCINDKLVARLAAKFTPLEVEQVVDKKDKLKSKLFLYQLEQLFKPTYSCRQCPANAAMLHMCKHCKKLLTVEQEKFLPCTAERLSISASGQVLYSHQRDHTWSVNSYVQGLQQQLGLTPRDLYWHLWSLVNSLKCQRCGTTFQCQQLRGCPYHPQPVVSSPQSGLLYPCCEQPDTRFSMLHSVQRGCCFTEHTVSAADSEHSEVYSILQQLHGSILPPPPTQQQQQQQQRSNETATCSGSGGSTDTHLIYQKEAGTLLCLLQGESPRYATPTCTTSQGDVVTTSSSGGSVEATPPNPSPSSCSTTSCSFKNQSHDQPVAGGRVGGHGRGNVGGGGGTGSEMEEDEEEEPLHRGVVTHHHAPNNSRVRRKVNPKQRHTRHDLKGPSQTGDWIWNAKKSRRWNQDMQRENDEYRQQQLITRLAQMSTKTSKSKEVVYAGGIYSKLEAQFRAQQAAKVMAVHPAQSRSHASVRKK